LLQAGRQVRHRKYATAGLTTDKVGAGGSWSGLRLVLQGAGANAIVGFLLADATIEKLMLLCLVQSLQQTRWGGSEACRG